MNELSNDYFIVGNNNFSGRNAFALGLCANAAYSDSNSAKSTLVKHGFIFDKSNDGEDQFRFINNQTTDTQCFVASDEKKTIVAFRGTQEDEDWVTNRMVITQDVGYGGKAHYGMLQAVLYLWDELWQTIRDFGIKKSVWFTGHSLGGALAVLAAGYCRMEGDKHPEGIYTYGAPRVGDEDFAANYDKHLRRNTFRYVNDLDIVPHLPPEGRTFKYKHVGYPCYFTNEGALKGSVSVSDTLKKSALQWFDRDITAELTADHNMSEYLTNLRLNQDSPINFKS